MCNAPPFGALTFQELMDKTGISDSTIWRWVKAGILPVPEGLQRRKWWPAHERDLVLETTCARKKISIEPPDGEWINGMTDWLKVKVNTPKKRKRLLEALSNEPDSLLKRDDVSAAYWALPQSAKDRYADMASLELLAEMDDLDDISNEQWEIMVSQRADKIAASMGYAVREDGE